jgi:hypothetical protein
MEQRPPFCTAKRDGSTIDSQKSWLAKDYYTQFQSDSELEKKYAGLGDYKVVLGNDDRQAGTGIATYSQGGVGAVRAVTECENNGLYKTIFTGSAFLSCADAGLKSIYSVVYDCRCGTCGNADKD